MMKNLFTIIFLFLLTTPNFAAGINIKVDAPLTIEVGEEFSLKYIISTKEVDNFIDPKFPPSIRVLYGRARSQMSSYQMINGKSSSMSTITYTYTLSAEETGTIRIPAAKVCVKGKDYNTRAVNIKVLKASNRQRPSASQQSSRGSSSSNHWTGGKISGKDLFIAVTANKKQVYEQEPVLLTYKIYARVNLTQLQGKMPDLKGFLIQEVPLPQQKSFSIEQYNGETYNSTVWCQYVMFPQQSGKLEIPSIKFDGVVAVANPNIDPFDAFFNGNTNFAEVKKSIIAPSVNINVKKLPEKPSNFSGAVGQFDVSVAMLSQAPRTNENMSVRVKINGVGNMKLISAPKLNLGADFDVYTPKLTDKTKLTAEGVAGTIVYDYVVVPHHKGNYTMPSIEFVYFDIGESKYKTIKTEPISFKVAQGVKISADDDETLQGDINDIHRSDISLPTKLLVLDNGTYYVFYLVIFILFIIAFVYLKKSEAFNNNTTLKLKKKAKSQADKHLKVAENLLKSQNISAFYDELTSALQTYASNRFAIPMSEFKSEQISEVMQKQGVSKDLSSELVDVMSQCEFARYAPGDPQENMENLYRRTIDVISKIENAVK